MTARTFWALLVVPIGLILPVDAGAVTCDGPAMPGMLTGCDDAAVSQLAPALGVDHEGLERIDVSETPSGKVVRLQQEVDGIPVFNGQVALRYDRAGNLDMVQASTIPAPAAPTVPTISAADAITRAGFGGSAAALVIYPHDGKSLLAWHVQRATPAAALNAIVDATDGTVLRSWNAILEATADTPVFNPNPVQTSGVLTLDDGADADATADTYATSKTLDLLDSATAIAGTYAADTNPAAAPGDASRTLLLPGGPSNFESANVYYAITEAQKKIQALGFTDVNNRTQEFNVNLLADDNSNYNSLTKALTFGSGGVDDAEDADVVLHEYGHSIQDNQVPGFGSGDEQGAMGEGFGDFLAGMFYVDQGDATYQATRRYCIAEWDATAYNPFGAAGDGSGCLRWIDGTDESDGSDIGVYSNTPNQVHDDGRYWSAGMTCIFEGLNGDLAARRDKALTLVIDSQQSLVPVDDNTAFEKQIASMIVSDQNLYAGTDVQLIRDCAAKRGLATLAETAPKDTTPPEVTAVVDPAAPEGKRGFYTRDVTVAWTVKDSESAVTTNGCDPVTVATDGAATLTCTATSSGGMTSKSVTINRQAKAPQTTLTKHPPKRTTRQTARFKFEASLDGARFRCSLDGGRFRRCGSPEKVQVGPGEHTFRVRAKSAAGKRERKPASFSWTVERP